MEYEPKAQCSQIEMEIVFVLEEAVDLILMAGWNESGFGKSPFDVLDDVVALYVNRAIVYQHGHQPARIDTKEPRLEVFACHQIDQVRLPSDAFEVQENTQLLRT
jgi:hypothetical protein